MQLASLNSTIRKYTKAVPYGILYLVRMAIIKTKKRADLSLKIMSMLLLCSFLFAQNAFAVEYTANASNKEVWQLNQEINDKRKAIDDLKKQADLYQKSLNSKHQQVATLNYQVATIDQTITKLTLEKDALELQIQETNLKIQNTELKIQATEDSMNAQRDRMADMVRTIFYADKKSNIVSVLATNDTLSDYVSQLQNMKTVQESLSNGLDTMTTLKIALVKNQGDLTSNKSELSTAQQTLDVKTGALVDQKSVKASLITETKGQETKYQQLLQDLRDQQTSINNDIVSLEQQAREKLNRQIKAGSTNLQSGPMAWPIDSRVITAYFHDPDYPYRNVFEHPAIDIKTAQGTPIKAVAGGYVARAKDGGKGYSYIMLVHDSNLSTVYGHVSAIYVTEGTFVTQGQIIGLSGGKPGSPGAGPLTTGAHLHLEVRLNGIPVNPLNYLP